MKKSDIERIDEVCGALTDAEREKAFGYMVDLTAGIKKINEYTHGATFFGSARVGEDDKNYKLAYELAKKIAEKGFPIITGGAAGIMEAANRAAFDSGGISLGFNIELPKEQKKNDYLTDSLTFNYFFARKVVLVAAAKAWVFFPGGFGTLDELTEVLTLVQTGKVDPEPIILFGSEFWGKFDTYLSKCLLSDGFIDKADRKIYTITDDIDVAANLVIASLACSDSKCLI